MRHVIRKVGLGAGGFEVTVAGNRPGNPNHTLSRSRFNTNTVAGFNVVPVHTVSKCLEILLKQRRLAESSSLKPTKLLGL